MDVKNSVMARYSEGAESFQVDLCCAVDYDPALMALLPAEIVEKDYGCGDPSSYVQAGDVVLDLGSGSGKICYMAAHLVGAAGQVIGVDMNDDMLVLSRKYQAEMADKLGEDRVRFVKGQIQNLTEDLDAIDQYLTNHPLKSVDDWTEFQRWQLENPMIADNSVDLVVSNCVLNLVQDSDKQQLISEIFRVLKPGGRIAISDIVSDQVVPKQLKKDSDLWSGCISGAWQEQAFLDAFAEAGFSAVNADKWQEEPWQVVEDIEFRSVTVTAMKPYKVSCCNGKKNHAVIYRGPYAQIVDDKGQVYPRGERVAVNEPTSRLFAEGAYLGDFVVFTADGKVKPTQVSSCCAPVTAESASAEVVPTEAIQPAKVKASCCS